MNCSTVKLKMSTALIKVRKCLQSKVLTTSRSTSINKGIFGFSTVVIAGCGVRVGQSNWGGSNQAALTSLSCKKKVLEGIRSAIKQIRWPATQNSSETPCETGLTSFFLYRG